MVGQDASQRESLVIIDSQLYEHRFETARKQVGQIGDNHAYWSDDSCVVLAITQCKLEQMLQKLEFGLLVTHYYLNTLQIYLQVLHFTADWQVAEKVFGHIEVFV